MTLTIAVIALLILAAACVSAWAWYHIMFNYVLPEIVKAVMCASKEKQTTRKDKP